MLSCIYVTYSTYQIVEQPLRCITADQQVAPMAVIIQSLKVDCKHVLLDLARNQPHITIVQS